MYSESVQIPSRSASSRHGQCAPIPTFCSAWVLIRIFNHIRRLTAAKEQGASIEIDGKKVALGIPMGGKVPSNPFAHIPLNKAATPDEAAGGVLL